MNDSRLPRWGAARRSARDDEFTAFVAASGPRLRRTAYLMCRDWHLAQDLTQTALAKLYAAWPRVRQSANLDAYSRRVLLNAVVDQRRRLSSTEVVWAEPPDRPAPEPAAELHLVLLDALAALSVRDQAIVVLRHWEDLSVAAVAEIVGVSEAVVKTSGARALTRLRARLGEDFIRS